MARSTPRSTPIAPAVAPRRRTGSAAARSASPLGGRGWLLAVVAAAVLAFVPGLDGQFVYDDPQQIAANPLIQDNALLGEALVSDVWAFRANPDEAGSNYWRPTFVAWLVLNYRLFGVDPFGWHVTNVLLHALVVGLAFGLMRKLGLDARLAAAVALLFAVHPTRVESVAWVSGSPDLLLAAATLGGLLAVLAAREGRTWAWGLALLLAALAMGAKEVGIVFPALAFALVWAAERLPGGRAESNGSTTRGPAVRRALLAAAPFAIVAAGYFVARLAVLGRVAQEATWDHGPLEALLTAPAAVAFYLRQMFVPFWLAPVYGLRPVTPDALTLGAFWLPLLVVAVAGVGAVWAARRGPVQAFGLALFVLPLLPALNVAALPPEHVVHDRYLYLPLLGALLLVVPTVAAALAARGRSTEKATAATLAGAAAMAALLLVLTVRYTPVWGTEEGLWARAVASDPASSTSWTQYGVALMRQNRAPDAAAALDRALALRPLPLAIIARTDLLLAEGAPTRPSPS